MLFSIAIPAYKNIFLYECIESILQQTEPDFELIIVNDCSPHPIDAVVKLFKDSRISYFKNEVNIGAENLVNNWNGCLAHAKGEFFIMMGDDDKMEPDYLAEFKKLIEKYPQLDVFHCRSKIIDENSTPIKLTPAWPEYESIYENIWHRVNDLRLQYISDFVYRTAVLKRNGGFYYLPLAWGSDDITAFTACGNKGIAHTNKPIFNYRESRYTISSTGNNYLKITAYSLRKKWMQHFLEQIPEDANDKILHADIKLKLNGQVMVQKVQLLAHELHKNFIKGFINSAEKLKDNEMDYKDLFKAALKSFRVKNQDK